MPNAAAARSAAGAATPIRRNFMTVPLSRIECGAERRRDLGEFARTPVASELFHTGIGAEAGDP